MLELVTLFTPHIGVGHCLHLMLELVIVNTSCWSWSHCLHLTLELVIVYTSCWSWSLLTPHVGVGHVYIIGVGHCWHHMLELYKQFIPMVSVSKKKFLDCFLFVDFSVIICFTERIIFRVNYRKKNVLLIK